MLPYECTQTEQLTKFCAAIECCNVWALGGQRLSHGVSVRGRLADHAERLSLLQYAIEAAPEDHTLTYNEHSYFISMHGDFLPH
jgi:hypothetical protein